MAVTVSQKWRVLDGDIYVSKWGSDANAGTMAQPKLTLSAAETALGAAGTIVIGEGVWDEPRAGLYGVIWKGDGLVVLEDNNATPFIASIYDDFHDIIFNQCSNMGLPGDTTVVDFSEFNCIFFRHVWQRVAAKDVRLLSKNCIFIECQAAGTTYTSNIVNCIFLNDQVGAARYSFSFDYTLKNTIIKSPNFKIEFSGAYTSQFDFCDIVGTIELDHDADTTYESRDLTWIKANTPSNQNSIDDDPLVLDESEGGMSISESSPAIGEGEAELDRPGFPSDIGALIGLISENASELYSNALSTINLRLSSTTPAVLESFDSVNEWAIQSEIYDLGKTEKLGRVVPFFNQEIDFAGSVNVYIKHGFSSGALSDWQRVKFYSEIPKTDGTYGNDDTNSVDADLKGIACTHFQFKVEASVTFKLGGLIVAKDKFQYFEEDFTKTAIEQEGSGKGNFTGAGYEILLLPQPDSEIDAATTGAYKIDDGTIYTYDEVVAIAAASPGSGAGHIELTYSNADPGEHNIEKIEVTVNAEGKIKTLFSFNN